MDKATFWTLCDEYVRPYVLVRDTWFRQCIPVPKRLAIFLDWAANGNAYQVSARLYDVSKTATCYIVRDVSNALKARLVPAMIKFPTGEDLMRCMADFKDLCHLPFCAGAIDGTFMHIEKPSRWGETFFATKSFRRSLYLHVLTHMVCLRL